MPASRVITGNTVTGSYTVARLNKDRLKDLAILHAAVYGTVTADHYVKKYDTAYTGIEYTGFIAYNAGNEPIGYYGVIPCFIGHGTKIILAAQSADTMTHPAYRLKGMFVELSEMVFGLCRQSGILLLFGFPNEHSYHGAVNKLNWKPVNQMSYFNIQVNALPLASIAFKKPFLKKCYARYLAFITRKYLSTGTDITNSVVNDGFAGISRTTAYLAYKNSFSQSKLIEIHQVKFRVSFRQSLLIGDMEGVDETNFDTMIACLKKLCHRLGIRGIQFHCSPDIRLHQLFAKTYTPMPSYHVLFQDFGSAIPPGKLRCTFSDIDIF